MHPDQTGVSPGALRFVMSVRAIGEGHNSSIGFRTGTLTGSGDVDFDPTPTFASTGRREKSLLEAEAFKGELRRVHGGGDDAEYVLGHLGPRFTDAEMEVRLRLLEDHVATRKQAKRTISLMRRIAERSYGVRFEEGAPLSERVLLPAMSAESKGIEDARFVRFVYEDGETTYFASYTAYNGNDIGQQLLETRDFLSFTSSPIVGAAAANKGLALFPRRIGGRFAALSRSDRESNTIAYTVNPSRWEEWLACQTPTKSWEVVQLGNCGSPIETEAGWLVLTHGVGPMRTYSIGAILLELEDPTQVIGQLREPLLRPASDEQNGYVPNVVYSCGALLHARHPCRAVRNRRLCHRRGDGASDGTSRRSQIRPHLTHTIATNEWRPPCLTDHRRNLRERSPENLSRRSGKRRRRSEKPERTRLTTWVLGR